jgi:uncharacterized cupredoxin-like copper-binding protein
MATELREDNQSALSPPKENGSKPVFETRTEERLAGIERELRTQALEARKTRRAYGLFATLAVVIAMVTLVAVGFKLDKKDTAVATSQPVGATQAPAPAPLGHTSAATLKEYTITPQPSQVAAGRVTFKVHNAGGIKHEFVVLRTNKPASQLLKGDEADETGNVGEIGDLQPGQTKALSLNLKAGHYALICNLPGHYKLGQHADLSVR